MQTYLFKPIRSAAILTNSYVAGTVIGAGTTNATADAIHPALNNQLIIYVDFTIGSLTDLLIKVEFSDDNSDFYQETFDSISGGTDTESAAERKFTATGKYRLAIPIKDNYIKISAKGEGTVTSSSLKIGAVIGVA